VELEFDECLLYRMSIVLVVLLSVSVAVGSGSATLFPKVQAQTAQQYIDEFEVPRVNAGPFAIAVDRNGNVWFSEDWFIQSNASRIARFDPRNQSFSEYPVPQGGDIWGIIAGAHNDVWFTDYIQREFVNASGVNVYDGTGRIGRLDTGTGNFTFVNIPTKSSFPMRLVLDGQRVWFTEFFGNKIGLYDTATHNVTEYPVPTQSSGPNGIALDQDGNVWFTESNAQNVAEFFPKNASFIEYSLGPNAYSPVGLLIDGRGSVWFADHGGNWIGKFDPATRSVMDYPTHLPSKTVALLSVPNDVLLDGKGRVWFAEHGGNSIGYFDPETQLMVEFPIPTGPISTVHWFALAPNGDIWFAEWSGNKIGRVNAALPIPASLSLSENSLTIPEGGQASVYVDILGSAQTRDNLTYLDTWASRNPSEVAVSFVSPSANSSSSTVQATIAIPVSTISGEYVLGVGVSSGPVLVWSFVRVTVTSSSFMPSLNSSFSPVILAVAAGVAFVAVLLYKARRRRKPNLHRGRNSIEAN
jgi:virginiamycin B lyase